MTGFSSLLIANRGEIALRILRAARSLDLRVIAVHSEADRAAAHVALADQAICIGPGPAAESYLDIGAVMMAVELSGAEAVHPGYGFLSENAGFAETLEGAGVTFVGPRAETIALMGDKISAKRAMREAGVPCVPGSDGPLPEGEAGLEDARRIAAEGGFPMIVKAAAGGGGRGMRVVRDTDALASALSQTREEARRAFGDGTLYMEKFLERPRHVEVQVLCDTHGTALWLGARDCSLQRRHQKLIEETPPPGIAPEAIAEIGARCAEACRAIGYVGAGTFEFLYEDGAFHFIEMNTRIQVEHPVTEEVTGIDLVREQIRVAQGHPLPVAQSDITFTGAAVECRINAEDPFTGRPSPGLVTSARLPGGPGLRVDAALPDDGVIPVWYDSMIAKVIARGATRAEALTRMRQALAEVAIDGVDTNVPLLEGLIREPDFDAGQLDIGLAERFLAARERAQD